MVLLTTGIEEGRNARPEGPALSIEGNPVTDRARISYEISRSGPVRCLVYDAAGMLVEEVLDGVQEPGRHSLSWSAVDAAPGLYFVQLQAEGATNTARLVKTR